MSSVNNSKEPLLRIAKRDGISRPKAYAIRLVAVLLSLVVSGIVEGRGASKPEVGMMMTRLGGKTNA